MSNETTNLILVVSTSVVHAYIVYALYWWMAEC